MIALDHPGWRVDVSHTGEGSRSTRDHPRLRGRTQPESGQVEQRGVIVFSGRRCFGSRVATERCFALAAARLQRPHLPQGHTMLLDFGTSTQRNGFVLLRAGSGKQTDRPAGRKEGCDVP